VYEWKFRSSYYDFIVVHIRYLANRELKVILKVDCVTLFYRLLLIMHQDMIRSDKYGSP